MNFRESYILDELFKLCRFEHFSMTMEKVDDFLVGPTVFMFTRVLKNYFKDVKFLSAVKMVNGKRVRYFEVRLLIFL